MKKKRISKRKVAFIFFPLRLRDITTNDLKRCYIIKENHIDLTISLISQYQVCL